MTSDTRNIATRHRHGKAWNVCPDCGGALPCDSCEELTPLTIAEARQLWWLVTGVVSAAAVLGGIVWWAWR